MPTIKEITRRVEAIEKRSCPQEMKCVIWLEGVDTREQAFQKLNVPLDYRNILEIIIENPHILHCSPIKSEGGDKP